MSTEIPEQEPLPAVSAAHQAILDKLGPVAAHGFSMLIIPSPDFTQAHLHSATYDSHFNQKNR